MIPKCFAVALIILSCLTLSPCVLEAATVAVNVGGTQLRFSPATVTIQVGDTVTWTNQGGIHNVVADDGSFTSGEISGDPWVFSHTFTTAGSFGYFCEAHASSGMRGTVVVQGDGGGGGGGGGQPGTLRFSLASYTAGEGAGAATITVNRTGGDDGAVSATFSAAAGTATAGSDFTPKTGTVSWADNDDTSKTFTVAILEDTADEPNETVALTLTNPTGGAALDNQLRNATLTITDNDPTGGGGGGGTAPAAPTNLQTMPHSTSEIMLAWTDNSSNESEFRIERKGLGGTFQQIATVPAGTTTFIVSGLSEATFYTFRVRAANATGTSAYSNEAGEATLAAIAPCVAGPTTLCVGNGGRFQIRAVWRTADSNGSGQALPIPTAPDSGLFYFFSPSNLEMLIKVLNGCGLNNRYWVFYAATTNVELTTTVIDTQTGRVKVYFNPLNTAAAPVQDTNALAVCP